MFIGIAMLGLDARYINKRFSARGQYIHAKLFDTKNYNDVNSSDLGSELKGAYLEAAYNLLPLSNTKKLDLFVALRRLRLHMQQLKMRGYQEI